jgi:hypothetical protein
MTIMAVFGPGFPMVAAILVPGLATVAMFVLLALVLGLFLPGIGSPRPYLATLASGADQQKWLRPRVGLAGEPSPNGSARAPSSLTAVTWLRRWQARGTGSCA